MVAQKAPKRFQHPASFSYLGVPAPAGMSDCYESMSWTTFRDRLPTRHSGECRSPGVGNLVAPALAPGQRPPSPQRHLKLPRERRKPFLPAPTYAIPPAIWMIVTCAPCGSFKHTNRPTSSTSKTGVISVAPSPFAFARDASRSATAR